MIQGVKGEVKNNTRYSLSFESYLSRQGNRLDTPEYGKPNAQRVNTTPSLPSFIANASSLNSEFKFVSSGCRKDVPGITVNCETYDGTTWSESGDLITARKNFKFD